jgi:hypothetical protein
MKFIRLLGIAVLCFGLAHPASVMAKSSNANENSQGYSSSGQDSDAGNNGNGSSGNGNAGGNSGNTNGVGIGNGNAGDALKDAADVPEDVPAANPADVPQQSTDQDAALDAVKSGKAVPLENIVTNVQQKVGGEVLDAHQFTERGFLLYEITVLQSDGKVKRVYYYAKSGLPVGQ